MMIRAEVDEAQVLEVELLNEFSEPDGAAAKWLEGHPSVRVDGSGLVVDVPVVQLFLLKA